MFFENGILKLSSYDIDHMIEYNDDIKIMTNTTIKNFEKSFNLKDIKEIIIPENIHFQELETSFKNIKELVKRLHSFGNNVNIFPYFGLNNNYVNISDINNLIKEYLTNNLKIKLNVSDCDYSYSSKSIEVKILLNNEEIASEYDTFSVES